jgi:hypothetical protein
MFEELESLNRSLCRSIGANRYDEARRIVDRCSALHTLETHHLILSIFERARRIALAQRSFHCSMLSDLQRARQYVGQGDAGAHRGVTG